MAVRWSGVQGIEAQEWRCAFCDREVAADRGWHGREREVRGGVALDHDVFVAVCPRCGLPTFLARGGQQIPGRKPGEAVEHLPEDVAVLYDEARWCMSVGAFTGAVLLGRKLLMHVAVAQGAEENKSFKHYVGYLSDQGVVTLGMQDWVDEIRELGNDANHEIVVMSRQQAEELLTFVAMLLKVVYEYPEKGRRSVAARRGDAPE
jgi:hypothetical protein